MAITLTPVVVAGTAGVIVAGTGHSEVAGDVASNTFHNNKGKTYILARNSGGTTRTLTPLVSTKLDGDQVTSTGPAISVVTAASRLIGPFDPKVYGGSVVFTVSNAELVVTAIQVA